MVENQSSLYLLTVCLLILTKLVLYLFYLHTKCKGHFKKLQLLLYNLDFIRRLCTENNAINANFKQMVNFQVCCKVNIKDQFYSKSHSIETKALAIKFCVMKYIRKLQEIIHTIML